MPPPAKHHNGESDDDKVTGIEAFGYAISDLIGTKDMAKALGEWISAHAKAIPHQPGIQKLQTWLGFIFGLAIFSGIGFLAWHKVINDQVAAGLLGTLIGYWFGHQKGKTG
jgi:hypothetical protein